MNWAPHGGDRQTETKKNKEKPRSAGNRENPVKLGIGKEKKNKRTNNWRPFSQAR